MGGQPLEHTPLWARDHSYANADLVAVLEGAGLHVGLAALEVVRAGPEALARLASDAIATGWDAVVCDAGTLSDLDVVAQATLPLADQVFWTGSAGLAHALAYASAPAIRTLPAATPITVAGGILLVVGSLADASRAASALLATDATLLTVGIAPAALRAGPDGAEWQAAAGRVAATLAAGSDVLVEIVADPRADLSQGAELARRLAELLRLSAPHAGALLATGGETALALLNAFEITGIRLLDEIEPGVPLGLTRGALAVPVVTKAGAFGDAGTLGRCLSHLRRLRQPRSPA